MSRAGASVVRPGGAGVAPAIAGVVMAGVVLAFASGAATAGTKVVAEGAIVRFECGDNCYLTIRRESGKELTGLCSAPVCTRWNDVAEMPKSFVGRRVRVTIGRGKQYDGAGNVMGTTAAFERIGFVK